MVTYNYVLLLNCSGTLGVGFYGNEEMKKGDNSMYSAASDAKDIIADVHKQVHLYELFTYNRFVVSGDCFRYICSREK